MTQGEQPRVLKPQRRLRSLLTTYTGSPGTFNIEWLLCYQLINIEFPVPLITNLIFLFPDLSPGGYTPPDTEFGIESLIFAQAQVNGNDVARNIKAFNAYVQSGGPSDAQLDPSSSVSVTLRAGQPTLNHANVRIVGANGITHPVVLGGTGGINQGQFNCQDYYAQDQFTTAGTWSPVYLFPAVFDYL